MFEIDYNLEEILTDDEEHCLPTIVDLSNFNEDSDYRMIHLCLQLINPDRDNLYAARISDYKLSIHKDVFGEDNFIPLYQDYEPKHFIALSANYCPSDILFDFLNTGFFARRSDQSVSHYRYLGFSIQNLRLRICVLYDTSLGAREDLIHRYGDFGTIRNGAKRSARIAQLFAPANPACYIEESDIHLVEDVILTSLQDGKKYNFTDGCGYVSLDVAKKITNTLEDRHLYADRAYGVPSVYQIRIKSVKGILVLEPRLPSGIIIRRSMQKFEWLKTGPHLLMLVNVSRPNECAAINDQIVRLLCARGVPVDVLFQKLISYFVSLRKTMEKPDSNLTNFVNEQINELFWSSRCGSSKANSLIRMHRFKMVEICESSTRDYHYQRITRGKLCVPIKDSRCVYGVADPTGELKYGQCFFQPTVDGRIVPFHNLKLVVTKNPCYNPSEIRILTSVDIVGCRHLVDCIVFPIQGDRPHCHEISGGDLDGDKYFVCWDEKLLPSKDECASSYPESISDVVDKIDYLDLVTHFCEFKYKQLSQVDLLYKRWFGLTGAYSEQCIELCEIFHRAVDIPKTGCTVDIPVHLKRIPKSYGVLPPSITGQRSRIYQQQAKYGEKTIKRKRNKQDVKTTYESNEIFSTMKTSKRTDIKNAIIPALCRTSRENVETKWKLDRTRSCVGDVIKPIINMTVFTVLSSSFLLFAWNIII